MIDGYWLPWKRWQRKILLVYYAYYTKKVIWFSIRSGEKKEYIAEDLRFLRDTMEYKIISCTSDGWVGILAALKDVYPECIIQRCLVHIQRQVKNYISGNPKTEAGKDLLRIIQYSFLSDVNTFPQAFENWKKNTFSFSSKNPSLGNEDGFSHTGVCERLWGILRMHSHICFNHP